MKNHFWGYTLGMTEQDFQIIERVAAIHGFTVHAAHEFQPYRVVTDHSNKGRSAFCWSEDEGFEEFFQQVGAYFHEKGYGVASRW